MDAWRADERVRVPGARCPFCHEEVPRGEEPAVCVACHALHHAGCLQEHGACAACGAAHPRVTPGAAPAEGRTTRGEGPWGPGRRPRTLLATMLFLSSVFTATLSLVTVTDAGAAGAASAVLVAALLGAAATIKRGALFGLTCASMALGGGLVVLLAVGPVPAAERAEVMAWAFALLTVSLVLGTAHLRARRTRGPPADAGKQKS